MKRLGIEIDAIVRMREFGDQTTPDPIHAITMIEMAGADGIVYTASEKPSSAEERDLRILRDCVHTHFNLRIPMSETMITKAIQARPEMVTLIQSGHQSGPINLLGQEGAIQTAVDKLRQSGAVTNVLIAPSVDQIKAAVKIGVDYVELHTASYATADSLSKMEQELETLKTIAMAASKLNLGVSASGSLHYGNLRPIMLIEAIEEINIGHSICARALLVGLDKAVRDVIDIIHS
ncbi:pyridoxine 5'-phosphate synthase [bacterium]|nr:pyridoxine 5'-phosphate synthase [bacterium]